MKNIDIILDRQYKQKQFFKEIFRGEIGKLGYLKDGQSIRILQDNGDYTNILYFNNIDDLVNYTSNKAYNTNTYFNLSTTNGEGGKEEDLVRRGVLGFDFDKKDFKEGFNHKDIINLFKSLGLYYHILVDSGNGYHAYMLIEPTNDNYKIKRVSEEIAKRLKADLNAVKITQLLRVPGTFNIKDKIKPVNVVHQFNQDTIIRYKIDNLFNRFCKNERPLNLDKASRFIKSNFNIPKCIEDILDKGSEEGQRYEDLNKIVVLLRDRGRILSEIKEVCREWAIKSNYDDNLEYQIENIFKNRKHVSLKCKDCKDKNQCLEVKSDFNYPDEFNLLDMTETHTKTLKVSKRRGARQMKPNDLLVYSILKNHRDGLYREEIIRDMTYKGKPRLSHPTLTKALQSLEDNGFIEVSGKPKFYKLKPIKSKIELTYNISYAAIYEAIKGHISTEELRLYNYMRYLHNKEQRENPKALKGNLFQFNQRDLAKDLDITQGRVSKMINNLLEEKLLGIWYRQPSHNNGYDYYIYRLNYWLKDIHKLS